MLLKPRYKRRIFWSFIIFIGVLLIALVLVPPMITLNGLKPKIEAAIAEQTGVKAKINGNINFSLLGYTTIVAHNVEIPIGNIGALMFRLPFTSIFDINNAEFSGDIAAYNANVTLKTLTPKDFNYPIEIHNSYVTFKGKRLEIIDATLDNGALVGTVRSENHKYDIDFEQDLFYVRNQNEKLEISGQLYSDGSIRGQLSMETNDINKLFNFSEPKIDTIVDLSAKFEWDGGKGYSFKDIQANKFSGNIEVLPNGAKIIQLSGKDVEYDFSFLLKPSRIFYRTDYNLDFYGKLKFGNYEFKHLKIDALGTKDKIEITNVIADDIAMNGGYIDSNGANNIMINMPYEGLPSTCVFSGTPDNWKCSDFSYGDYSGSLSVNGDKFEIFIQSDKPMPDRATLIRWAKKLGTYGKINFQFKDIAGSFDIAPEKIQPSYTFAQGKTLQWLNPNIKNIPEFMRTARGDFKWDGDTMIFIPETNRWILELSKNNFKITGKNAKEWFPNLDLQSINNLEYTVSGAYNGENISNLKIQIAGQVFTGAASGKNVTLHTTLLNIDSFVSQTYLDNYEELEFLTPPPILIPFEIPVNVSLSADSIIYNGDEFKNFVYSLKSNIQTFSITDSARGNLLTTISKENNRYKIFAQLNKFLINGSLLSSNMPLNIKDSMITAEINMKTFGNIAHDIKYNMSGEMDLSFDGGYLVGLGIDNFYASANNLTTLNAELSLANALESGESLIKKMRIIGKYDNGNFETTSPIVLQLRHTDATGEMSIIEGNMQATFNMTLRGTSPSPTPIELEIQQNNKRKYSLSEIMRNFDPTFMRGFIKTHSKF